MKSYHVGSVFPNGDRIVAVDLLYGCATKYTVEQESGEVYEIGPEEAEAYMNSEVWE